MKAFGRWEKKLTKEKVLNPKFSVILFILFSFLPVIPLFTSFYELRRSVILDQKVNWTEGHKQSWTLPPLQDTNYEFRLESDDSKWEPIIKAKWALSSSAKVVAESPNSGLEWNLVRPFLVLKNSEALDSPVLEIQFLNSSDKTQAVRLKVSKSREQILEKQTRLFIILLAFSLGFIVLIWKPFLTVNDPKSS